MLGQVLRANEKLNELFKNSPFEVISHAIIVIATKIKERVIGLRVFLLVFVEVSGRCLNEMIINGFFPFPGFSPPINAEARFWLRGQICGFFDWDLGLGL